MLPSSIVEGFFFRAPGTPSARSSVFRFAGERAVADLDLGDDVDPSTVDVPSLDASFDEVEAFIDRYRGDLFLFNERFPGGFTPRFGADIRDMSLVGGLRGERDNGLKWDASVSAARSTINASLGPATPTSSRPRDYIQTEVAANLDAGPPSDGRAPATSPPHVKASIPPLYPPPATGNPLSPSRPALSQNDLKIHPLKKP